MQRLVHTQRPQWADLGVTRLGATGSSNVLFRLGDDLLVRLPRQPGGSAGLATEARWGPHVGSLLGLPVPEVVAVGEPGEGYPESWSVTRWLPGVTAPLADGTPPEDRSRLVAGLADALLRLRAEPVPVDALTDPGLASYRAGPLVAVAEEVEAALVECRALPGLDLDLDLFSRRWHTVAASRVASRRVAPRWTHGDLVAENLLVDARGALAAVLDLGALAVGDPAVDLVAAWEVLGTRDRGRFLDRVGAGADERTLARGWVLAIALLYYSRSRCRTTGAACRCAARLGCTPSGPCSQSPRDPHLSSSYELLYSHAS